MRIGNFVLQALFASNLLIIIQNIFPSVMASPNENHYAQYYSSLSPAIKSLIDDKERGRLVSGDAQHARGSDPEVSMKTLGQVQDDLQGWLTFEHHKYPKIVRIECTPTY